MAKDNNGWDDYKRVILQSLESLQKEVACLKQTNEARIKEFNNFRMEYNLNVAKVKVYLSLGVAVGTAFLQIGLYYIQRLIEG